MVLIGILDIWEIGTNYSAKNDDNIEFTVSIFNLIFEHEETNIGIEFNPIKYWYLFEFKNEPELKKDGSKFSFINVAAYWNLVENTNIILGPFVSINYMYINTSSGINMNEYTFSGGLCFSLHVRDNKFLENYSFQVNSEIRYRNIMGNNKFYWLHLV
ncbi:MAG: hypothetical protein Pg6C_11370 [Treponemataceae bacterium]|nr:MAG: hypothetical protein Pg6C_11370 [Treponemataceae bacterium]